MTDHNEENHLILKMESSVASQHGMIYYITYSSDNIEWDWINNAGGSGTMHIDCTKDPWKVKIDHSQNVTRRSYLL